MTEPNNDDSQNKMYIYAQEIRESKNHLESLQSTIEYQKSEMEIKKNKVDLLYTQLHAGVKI